VIYEDEILMLVLGLGVLTFMLLNYSNLKRIVLFKLLAISFCMFVAGCILTVLEGFFWEDALNFLEHTSYAAGAIFMAIWFWRVFGKAGGAE